MTKKTNTEFNDSIKEITAQAADALYKGIMSIVNAHMEIAFDGQVSKPVKAKVKAKPRAKRKPKTSPAAVPAPLEVTPDVLNDSLRHDHAASQPG